MRQKGIGGFCASLSGSQLVRRGSVAAGALICFRETELVSSTAYSRSATRLAAGFMLYVGCLYFKVEGYGVPSEKVLLKLKALVEVKRCRELPIM